MLANPSNATIMLANTSTANMDASTNHTTSRSVQISSSSMNSFTHHQHHHNAPAVKNFKFPVNLHAAITSPHPMRIKRERSPIHTISSQSLQTQSIANDFGGMRGELRRSSPTTQPNQSITTVTPVTSGGQLMHPSIQLQHPMRDAAILFRVKNDVQLPGGLIQSSQQQNRMLWNSARINGVKPEIIGGSMPGLRSPVSSTGGHTAATSSHGQTPTRTTPTVIMGESCGVRTMVWGFESPSPSPNMGSQPQQTQQQQQQQQPTQQHSSQNHQSAIAGTSSNNEEAAQLLLSLGQSRTNELRPLQSQPTMRSQHPLNMERLWAGDYSQLPAGQQMHALNLSAQQQWGGPIQPMKVNLGKIQFGYFVANSSISKKKKKNRMNTNRHRKTTSSHWCA